MVFVRNFCTFALIILDAEGMGGIWTKKLHA
jgi:hypothetical protein